MGKLKQPSNESGSRGGGGCGGEPQQKTKNKPPLR